MPKISILIRAKNEERFIGQALESISRQEIEYPYEVIVLDSGSTDRTLAIVRKFKVRLFELNPGAFTFGYALNYGKDLAKGEFIVNLSAHCIPVDSKWLANLVAPLMKDPSISATHGRQIPLKGINPFEEQILIREFTPDEEGNISIIFSNSNSAIRKQVWEKYPFDEMASHAEDFIWAKTLPSEYKIKYIHDAPVYHSHPFTFKYWAKRYKDSAMVEKYIAHVYKIEWPWKSQILRKNSLKKILTVLNSYIYEFLSVTFFLIKNGYYRHIFVLPAFLILRRHYTMKGLKEGERLYGT